MATRIFISICFYCVIYPGFALAKAPTAEVTITGPHLEKPLHTSDAAIIAANVWAGNFADFEAGATDNSNSDSLPYQVHFWVRLAADDIRLKYVLEFRWLEGESRGIVCLPGRDKLWYRTNVYTILRTGQDGKCFYADEDWGRSLHGALIRARLQGASVR